MSLRDDVILWVHETVGDALDGEASLAECIEWIMLNGTDQDRAKVSTFSLTLALETGK